MPYSSKAHQEKHHVLELNRQTPPRREKGKGKRVPQGHRNDPGKKGKGEHDWYAQDWYSGNWGKGGRN